VLDAANKYIVATAPFTLAKDPDKLPRVAQILVNLLEGLRVIAGTLEPFMPRQAAKLLELLGVDEMVSARFDPSCASDSTPSKYAIRSLFIQTDCPPLLSLTNAICRSTFCSWFGHLHAGDPSALKISRAQSTPPPSMRGTASDLPRRKDLGDFRA
jgi:hypothetical protein